MEWVILKKCKENNESFVLCLYELTLNSAEWKYGLLSYIVTIVSKLLDRWKKEMKHKYRHFSIYLLPLFRLCYQHSYLLPRVLL